MTINEIVKDTFKEYLEADAVNASLLKDLKTDPLTAFEKGQQAKPPHTFKAMYNRYILQTLSFFDHYKTYSGASLPGKDKRIEITQNDFNTLQNMRDKLHQSNKLIKELLNDCDKKVSLYTNINMEGFNIPIKCRFHGINIEKGFIVHLVPTASASPWGFGDIAGRDNMHIQAAFYMFIARYIFKKPFKMYYIVQEQTAPYYSALYNVSSAMRYKGEAELLELLPAAAAHRENQEKPSGYDIFCPNDSGVFDLDISDSYAKPRHFYFNNK